MGRSHGFSAPVMLLALAAATSCALGRSGAPAGATDAAALVPFTAPESMARLGRSHHRVDFFHLANEFESQTTRTFCGPTSAAIVLNALRADAARPEKPEDPSLVSAGVRASLPFDPLYHRYTQNDLFTPAAERVKTRNAVLGQSSVSVPRATPGLELRQLHQILETAGVDSRLRVVDDGLPDATVRAELVDNLGTADDYVIVNYSRAALGQEGGGHISPLGAYDEASDSFLILDVNPNGHRWVWAPAAALIRAMRTRDASENRGYLLVREGAQGGGATVNTKPPL